MIRIGITGTHSTGKTTLAHALVERIRKETGKTDIVLVKEQVRKVCEDYGFEKLEDMLSRGPRWLSILQWEALRRQINTETEVIQKDKGFVSDRTTLDNLAYYMVGNYGEDTTNVAAHYTDIAIKHSKTYDVIFFVPPTIPITDDGFRQIDPVFRNTIDRQIQELIVLNRTNYYSIIDLTA